MKVHIYSVKDKSQAGNIRVKHIMTTQKGQSLGNLPIMLEIQQRALGPGESAAGATYISLRIENLFNLSMCLFLFNICLICWYDNLQSI